jgi:two-component system nitrate/nitrite response regulator NarL
MRPDGQYFSRPLQRQSLIATQPDMRLLARCADGEAALAEVRAQRPDVLVLDLRMPRMDGLTVLRELKKDASQTKVVVLTAAVSNDDVIEAARLGVRGVVLKEMAPKMLVNCIRKVHKGGRWLEHASMGRALDQLVLRQSGERELAKLLTARELDVVRCVAEGLRNKEIARRLDINEGTVKLHLHNAYSKLGVDGRLALSVYLREKGIA